MPKCSQCGKKIAKTAIEESYAEPELPEGRIDLSCGRRWRSSGVR